MTREAPSIDAEMAQPGIEYVYNRSFESVDSLIKHCRKAVLTIDSAASRIAHARETGHDAIADECAALADMEPLAVFDEAGNKRYDPGSIAWRKMQIETRVKLLAKWNPRKYGDKTVLAGDPEAPLAVTVDFATFDAILTNMELLRHDGKPS